MKGVAMAIPGMGVMKAIRGAGPNAHEVVANLSSKPDEVPAEHGRD